MFTKLNEAFHNIDLYMYVLDGFTTIRRKFKTAKCSLYTS